MKKILIIILIIVVLGVTWAFLRGPEDTWLCADGEWVKHGNPSAPKPTEPCGGALAEGTGEEEAGAEEALTEKVVVEMPQPNAVVSSPLDIEGRARGSWFFEGDFPVKLLDESGKELGAAIAMAQGEWMTEDFVLFKTTLEFSAGAATKGTLVFEKDNPSGLPEHAGQVVIPVRFQAP